MLELPMRDFAALVRVADATAARKRKVFVYPRGSVTFQDLNWSGGTKSEYTAIELATGKKVGDMSRWNMTWPGDNKAEGATIDVPPGVVVVRTGWFCGKTSTPSIYCNPADMPALLPGAFN